MAHSRIRRDWVTCGIDVRGWECGVRHGDHAQPGMPEALAAAYDSLRGHGSLVLIGGVRQDLTIPYDDLMHRGLILRGSRMSDEKTLTTVWSIIRSGLLDLSAIEPLTVGLDAPATALDLAERTTGLRFVTLVP